MRATNDMGAAGQSAAFDLSDVHVMLAMPTNRDLPVPTVKSLVETALLLRDRGIAFDIEMQVGSSIVESARNGCADAFLKRKEATHLFWVDSDVTWRPADFLRLLAFATRLPIVAGSYPAKKEPLTFMLNEAADAELATNEFGCLPIRGVGLGFAVVRREVMEALEARSERLIYPDSSEPRAEIFHDGAFEGRFQGEDMWFFADARNAGFQAWLDPSLTLGHVGQKTYSGSISEAMRAVAPQPAAAAA